MDYKEMTITELEHLRDTLDANLEAAKSEEEAANMLDEIWEIEDEIDRRLDEEIDAELDESEEN